MRSLHHETNFKRNFGIAFTCGLIGIGLISVGRFNGVLSEEISAPIAPWTKDKLAKTLTPHVESNILAETLSLNVVGIKQEVQLEYTIDAKMQEFTDRLMKRARPDFGALVAVDATTGEILTMSSYSHDKDSVDYTKNLNLVASFPAASIFKVVTAAAALEMQKVKPETKLILTGRAHTLYKKDVIGPVTRRWSRTMSITDAFAKSTNTLFGKLGLYFVGADNLQSFANLFGFNQNIYADFYVPKSAMELSENDDWGVVEAASGYNTKTTLSPMHGALLAAAVANDGMMMEPFIVKTISDDKNKILYQGKPKTFSEPISPRASQDLKILMEATIRSGTSRKSFRKILRHKLYADASFGGKTGSLMGKNPEGKTDWFVGYMEHNGRRIALASVFVHGKIWRIRSSQMASSYFEQFMYRSITENKQIANR